MKEKYDGSDGDESDGEDPKQHAKLIAAISRLDYKQRVKPPSRKEPSVQVSEFHLAKGKTSKRHNAVKLGDLAGILNKGTSAHVSLSRKIKAVQKTTKTLPKPLEKIEANKIERTSGFEKAKSVLSRWDSIVSKNRTADQLEFPLNKSALRIYETNIYTAGLTPKTELEQQIQDVLKSCGYIKENESKDEDSFPLTLKEVLEQRKEAARLRTQTRYQQMKAWRQNRIKSKKFHRVLRKERVRQQIKEFETLKETDPEEALKRLDQLEKTRANERASLRHRNTGPWAKNKAIRAKYDRESRQALAQQLSISRDLTQKIKPVEASSESDEEEVPDLVEANITSDNPWGQDVKSFISGYRKYWEEKNSGTISVENQVKAKPSTLIPLELPTVDEKVCKQSMDESKDSTSKSPGKKKSKKAGTSILPQCSKEIYSKSSKNKCSSSSIGWKVTDVDLDSNITKVSQSGAQKNKKKSGKESVPPKNKKSAQLNIKNKGSTNRKKVEVNDIFDGVEQSQAQKFIHKLNLLKKSENIPLNDDSAKLKTKPTKKRKRSSKKARIEAASSHDDKKMNDTDKDEEIDRDEVKELRPILGFKKPISVSLVEESVETSVGEDLLSETQNLISLVQKNSRNDKQQLGPVKTQLGPSANIDPSKFLTPKALKSKSAEMISTGLEALDDMEEEEEAKHRVTIAEAFAEDDVVDTFRKEKEDLEEASKPKEIDLTLPGWGEWGGKNIRLSIRKRKRFILKPTQEAPRKDRNKQNVILYEGKDSGLMNHQVSELPFPFTSVKDFEASVRAPVGSTWVPETAHRKLIAPRIVIQQGQIIAPMTEDDLLPEPEKKTKKIFK